MDIYFEPQAEEDIRAFCTQNKVNMSQAVRLLVRSSPLWIEFSRKRQEDKVWFEFDALYLSQGWDRIFHAVRDALTKNPSPKEKEKLIIDAESSWQRLLARARQVHSDQLPKYESKSILTEFKEVKK